MRLSFGSICYTYIITSCHVMSCPVISYLASIVMHSKWLKECCAGILRNSLCIVQGLCATVPSWNGSSGSRGHHAPSPPGHVHHFEGEPTPQQLYSQMLALHPICSDTDSPMSHVQSAHSTHVYIYTHVYVKMCIRNNHVYIAPGSTLAPGDFVTTQE